VLFVPLKLLDRVIQRKFKLFRAFINPYFNAVTSQCDN